MADFQNIINNQTSDQPVQNQIDQASEQPVGNDRGNTADAFNTIMLDLLKESKGIDNTQLLRKRRELRRGVLDTTQQPTEEGLRTLSPSQQSALRSSSARALEPELDKIDTDIAKSQQLSDSFFKRFELSQSLGENISKKMVASDEELESFKQLVESGQMSIKDIAGLTNESTLHKLLQNIDPNLIPKDGSKRRTQLSEVGGDRVLTDLETGEIIKNYGPIDSAIKTQKPKTQMQFLVSGFAKRIEEAEDIFSKLEKNDFKRSSFLSSLGTLLPNRLESSEIQQQQQAERNFVNAVLRRESGAAILPSEFTSAELQYFPRFGDKPEVVANKKRNREIVLDSFIKESGEQVSPQDTALSDTQINFNPNNVGRIITLEDGSKFTVDSDGDTLIPLN